MKPGLRRRAWLQMGGDPIDDGHLSLTNFILIVIIVAAVATAVLATEPAVTEAVGPALLMAELAFGVIFLVEYCARIWTVAEAPGPGSDAHKRLRFILSPLGLLDLAVVVVSLVPLLFPEVAVLRLVRLLRVFMLAKLGRFSSAFRELAKALHDRRYELYVTIVLALVLMLLGATALYLVEGHIQPEKFGSIPRALWWSIITLTTIGYGDVSPITPLGKFIAAIVAVAGVGLVAMPAGIMAGAFSEAMQARRKKGH